jgi:hypothetical protein
MYKSRKRYRHKRRRKNTRRFGGSTVTLKTATPNSAHSSATISNLAVNNQNNQVASKV